MSKKYEYLTVYNVDGRRNLLGIFKCKNLHVLISSLMPKIQTIKEENFFIEWTDITDIEYNIELTGRIRSERPPYIHSFHYDAKFAEHLRIASWYKLEIEQISALI
ncbi:hypothetical protein UA38_11630 [Photobacterium kishitanii]|uniref:Uncharacterized protein n=1 Tax=Photobacterium kishitanii TaxID=318456 RepID=A0AAX0YTW4_9GAMM|nr:hypothetical protein [Photobacterium kishitanii]KJG57021.1 hypothetical protein UA38_11630 [Photobacterium kishitanii]KJG60545.1 hypothetical protein UA42_14415 [Photobacterium kishitanii]KJG64846.1 hypothetical protein UA40_14105 [Photobacterium kishitanii]KJG68483.1 hypothetical protein UA41_16520 [Photobacterium kishitanii]PSW46669.1 hypothetical protein C0W66_22315 [Photobacterium kishitanii]